MYGYPHNYGPYSSDIFYRLYKYESGNWQLMTDTVPKSYLEYNGYIFGASGIGLLRAIPSEIITDMSYDEIINDNLLIYPTPSI